MTLHPPFTGHHDPQAELERALFEEYLRSRGSSWDSLAALPQRCQNELLRDAAGPATRKLSEIEACAHYLTEIGASHG
jgi:hypothetical protein